MRRFSNYNGIFTFLEKSAHFALDYFSYLNDKRQNEYQSRILQLSGCPKMPLDFLYIFLSLIMPNMQVCLLFRLLGKLAEVSSIY